MSDKYEPYLEPLFIPGVLGLVLVLVLVYDGIYRIYGLTNEILGLGFILIALLSIPISLVVLIYEVLLLTKVIKPGVFINTKRKLYLFLRWLLAVAGLVAIVFSGYLILLFIVMSQAGPFIPG